MAFIDTLHTPELGPTATLRRLLEMSLNNVGISYKMRGLSPLSVLVPRPAVCPLELICRTTVDGISGSCGCCSDWLKSSSYRSRSPTSLTW
jgi:hypothetical protein